VAKKKIAEYEAPAMDEAVKQELDEFVAKRSAELVK
jgi:trimethylamine:corrinoid methyltransferase-like protein